MSEDDESDARYDPGSGYLTVTVSKETRGEYFRDLDVLARLLAPPRAGGGGGRQRGEHERPVIEVVKSENSNAEEGEEENEVEKELSDEVSRLTLEQREIINGNITYHISNPLQLTSTHPF